jgi:hypothetical protein
MPRARGTYDTDYRTDGGNMTTTTILDPPDDIVTCRAQVRPDGDVWVPVPDVLAWLVAMELEGTVQDDPEFVATIGLVHERLAFLQVETEARAAERDDGPDADELREAIHARRRRRAGASAGQLALWSGA